MEARTYTSTTGCDLDADALYESLTEAGRDTMLFGSPAGSLVIARSAVRIEGRGREITLTALTDGGLRALARIEPELARLGEIERRGLVLSALMPERPRTGTDADRITAPSVDDALRLAATGWSRPEAEAPIHLAGVFSYDHVERLEPLPPPRSDRHGFPDLVFWLPEVEVSVQRGRATIALHAYGRELRGEGDGLDAIVERIASCVPSEDPSSIPGRDPGRVDVDLDDEEYAGLVARLKSSIVAGDVFQIVPSRTFSVPCPDALPAFRTLARANPSPYHFFVRGRGFTLFGTSPEACVRVGADREVELHPIAGTRPRGRAADGTIDPVLDARLESELLADAKELAEHMMLVDLARNDVARVSRAGTRRVTRLLEVERYSHVMHLTSTVRGTLRDGLDALHAYAASANMGTLVGAPKIEAARILRACERDRRGPYGGAVGTFSSSGEMETAIVIRAALVVDGTAYVRAGAGVVFDSDPAREAHETRAKADAVLGAIRASGGGS